jgi:hypothetical protein
MYEPSLEILEVAAEAAERLIGFYPTITASDPKVYAAGLVKLFSHYPEHLIAEAIDPVNGLPGECDYLPTIAKVKAFLEPRRRNFERMQDCRERAGQRRLPEPPRDPEADARVEQGFRKLIGRLN